MQQNGPSDPDPGRPQDQARSHRRKGSPTAATRSLLVEYQEAMRAELRGVLVELAGTVPDPGLGMVPATPVRPALADRMRLWDLAIKLGRELGSEIEPLPPAPGPGATVRPGRRRRAEFG